MQILEYWVVNLKDRTLIIFRDPQEGDYISKVMLSEGKVAALAFLEIALAVEVIVSF